MQPLEIGGDLGLALGGDTRGQQDPHDARDGEAATLRDLGDRDHSRPALGHELPRHTGQRPRPVRLHHLIDGGAALGQIAEQPQPIGRCGIERIAEAGLAPDLLLIHPFTPPRRGWRTSAPGPSP